MVLVPLFGLIEAEGDDERVVWLFIPSVLGAVVDDNLEDEAPVVRPKTLRSLSRSGILFDWKAGDGT